LRHDRLPHRTSASAAKRVFVPNFLASRVAGQGVTVNAVAPALIEQTRMLPVAPGGGTDQGWRITAIHNGRVRPITVPDPDALPSRMSRLMTRTAHRLGIGRHRAQPPTPDAPHASAPPPQRARSGGLTGRQQPLRGVPCGQTAPAPAAQKTPSTALGDSNWPTPELRRSYTHSTDSGVNPRRTTSPRHGSARFHRRSALPGSEGAERN
jgi:hypothetical protein